MKRRARNAETIEAPGESLGSRLARLRAEKGIEIELAAHETRIRVTCLREIEANDFSRLPSAYARMILRNYARYLGVTDSEMEADLPEAVGFGVAGYEYIRNAPANDGVAQGHHPGRRVAVRPRGSHRTFILVPVVVIATAFIGFQAWVTIRKLDRINQSAPVSSSVAVQSRVSPEQEIQTFRAVGESDSEWLLTPGNAMVGENPPAVPVAEPLSESL
jgi:cytoskeletal protein RodZ